MSKYISIYFVLFVFTSFESSVLGRAVNISNTWILPEEGFPVFYRYFKDRISWYEADAVCQFHHANLVTVDTTAQYDATRAYLKELDIVNNVWIGLIKSKPDGDFTWTERREYRPLTNEGYWDEAVSLSGNPLCASTDPASDYRWHSHHCGGPEVASFICELPVPAWANQPNGCMLTSLPSLTVLYLPEQAAVELTSDCGLEGTKSIVCKGQADRDEMIRQLSCGITPEDFEERSASKSPALNFQTSDVDEAPVVATTSGVVTNENSQVSNEIVSNHDVTRAWLWNSNTIDVDGYETPTRHRRETQNTDLPATLSTLYASTFPARDDRKELPLSKIIDQTEELSQLRDQHLEIVGNDEDVVDNVEVLERIDTPKMKLIQANNQNNRVGSDGKESVYIETIPTSQRPDFSMGEHHTITGNDNFFADVIVGERHSEEIPEESTSSANSLITTTTVMASTTASTMVNHPAMSEQNSDDVSAINSATDSSTSSDLQQHYANSEAEFPSAINQGQLFGSGGENATHFDLDENETSSMELEKIPPATTAQRGQITNEQELTPSATPAVVTTENPNVTENIKLLELDTDFTASKSFNSNPNNLNKFVEIDDSFTIGNSQPHEHKVIEINIIDRKTQSQLPSRLIITTKINNAGHPRVDQTFTGNVKKDGKNIFVKNATSTVLIDPKLDDLNGMQSPKINIESEMINPIDTQKIENGKFSAMDASTVEIGQTSSTIPSTPNKEITAAQQTEDIRRQFIPIPLRDRNRFDSESDKKELKNPGGNTDDSNADEPETKSQDDSEFYNKPLNNNDEDDLNQEIPPRPNRGRLLTRSPHHSYYPYFFSRVLG